MELPNFDTPQQSDAPAPRKPRQKPTKRRKVAKKKAIVKTRKKRAAKPKTLRLTVMFDAVDRIREALGPLTREEARAVIESIAAS